MKPAYWIAVMALLGAVIGYGLFRATGWLGTGVGLVLGILLGALLYTMQTGKTR